MGLSALSILKWSGMHAGTTAIGTTGLVVASRTVTTKSSVSEAVIIHFQVPHYGHIEKFRANLQFAIP